MSARYEEMAPPLCDGEESGTVSGGNVTRRLRVGRPRYYVTELKGWPIGPTRISRDSEGLLSCSVLDTYYNNVEVARFNEENVRPRTLSKRSKQRAIRARAAGCAAILNAEHADA